MAPSSGVVLSMAYILGLLSTCLLSTTAPWTAYWILALGIGTLGVGGAFIVPRFWRTGPKSKLWIAAGIVSLIAVLYFKAQVPQLTADDISKFVPATQGKSEPQVVTVQGKIVSTPRLTRSQKSQFWLEANQLNEVEGRTDKPADVNQKVSGKLYVTVPLLQATGLYPGQQITVTGSLYKPEPSIGQCTFNFQAYLAREGGFAGLSGRQVNLPDTESGYRWGWWVVRKRIIQSLIRSLNIPEGSIVSAMVIGGRAVDLPYDVRDNFVGIGLAHALAASGFQVSLILGVILTLTRRLSARLQFSCGVVALIIFVGLTGLEASVLRAAVMGFGALIALVMQRRVKPLGSLLLAATLLLLFNPLWIWDLGFQLSFLATMGLLVTVPPLTNQLDWLPPTITALIAVPIAATLWTLPLQIHSFCLISPYSLLANVVTAPFISLISLGGFISAVVALIWSMAGSTLALVLYYPTHWLILIVEFFAQLPGNSVAIGAISIFQLIALYGLIGLVWLQPWWQQRWWLAGFIGISLVVIPTWQTQAMLFQVTVLPTTEELVMVIQDQGRVTLVNTGDDDTTRFTVLPFLQQQGVNRIDTAIAVGSEATINSGWSQLLERVSVKFFYTNLTPLGISADKQAILRSVQAASESFQNLQVGQPILVGSSVIKLLNVEPPVLQLQIRNKIWLLLGELKSAEQKKLAVIAQLPHPDVLWWTGERLMSNFLASLRPVTAIASSTTVDSETAAQLGQGKTQLYWTGRDGTLHWTPSGGFKTRLETTENDSSF